MAGPVRGTFGEENIELQDAATETTLLALVKAVEKMSRGSDDNNNAAEQVKKLGNESKNTTESVEELGEASESAGSKIRAGFDIVGDAVLDIADDFLTGADRISEFTSHITGAINQIPMIGGLIGGPLQLLVSTIDSNIDNFRLLTDVGTDFGGSLFNAQLQASRAGLSLSVFTDAIRNNSEGLAIFTGSASEASRRFTEISGNIQRNLGPQFSSLGMVMEETAQFTADYLELQARLGNAQRMTNFQLSQGAGEFILQLDRLSKITGKRREQIAQELKDVSLDERIRGVVTSLGDLGPEVASTILSFRGIAPDVASAVTDLVGAGGVAITEQASALKVINPRLAELSQGLANGTVSQAEFQAELRRTAATQRNMSDEELRTTQRLANLGNPIAQLRLSFLGLEEVGKGLTEAQQQQLDADERRNNALLDFERRLQQFRNIIIDTMISSGIFQAVENGLSDVVDFITGPDGVQSMKDGIQLISDSLKGVMADIEALGLAETLKMYISDAFSGLGSMIKDFVFGGSGSQSDTANIDERIAKFQTEIISETDPAKIENLAKRLEILKARKAELTEESSNSEGLFSGLIPSRETIDMLSDTGEIVLGFTAFAAILGAFGAGPTLLGIGLITGLLVGTGYGIKQVGEGIDSVGAGLERVGGALQSIANIQGADNLIKVVQGLEGIGPALLTLAGSNALEAVLDFFGAGNPFEEVIKGVNHFADANTSAVANIKNVGQGLEGLSAVTDSLDTTGITAYTKAITELTKALDKLNDELGEDNRGTFGGGTGVSAGSLINQGQLGMGNGNQPDKLDQLNTTMSMVLQTLQTMQQTSRKQLRATEGMGNTVQ